MVCSTASEAMYPSGDRAGERGYDMNFNHSASARTFGRVVALMALVSAGLGISPVRAEPRWPLPDGVKSVAVNGYDMAYLESGSGAPVVLVHGALSDYRIWNPVASELAKRFHVVTVSLRHHYPEKWDGKGNDYSYEQHAADVAVFIKTL